MTNITTLRPGEHFMFKGFEWVCLDPHHPDGGVLAIMAKPWRNNLSFCSDERYADEKGNWNNYLTSSLRKKVLGLVEVIGSDNLITHEVDLVADNGDRAYGTVQDFVFILTCDEYHKYRDYIPHYVIPIWTATPWCCGNKYSDVGIANVVRFVNAVGWVGSHCAHCGDAVAPACVLNPKSLNLRKSMAYLEEVSE